MNLVNNPPQISECSLYVARCLQGQKLDGNIQGVLNGNMGVVVFLYCFSRAIQNPKAEEAAYNLLDKVVTGLTANSPADFENGLAGIGWGIEYLVQNSYVEGDTDEILEEVDTMVFKFLNDNKVESFEVTYGLTGYLLYLISRLRNKADHESMAYRVNKALLIQCINKLDELVADDFPAIAKEMQFDLFWRFPVLMYALTEAYKLSIYDRKIDQMIRQWVIYFEAHVPSLQINRLYLALALKNLNIVIGNNRIEKQIQILLFAVDFNDIDTEFEINNNSPRHGWPGIVWVLYQAINLIPNHYPNYQAIIKYYHRMNGKYDDLGKRLSQVETSEKPLQGSISSGIMGVGLMEIFWPGIFQFCK